MLLVEIGTAGAISAYFIRHITSGYSLNVSDPIEGQPVQLSYYLCVFGCGLVFWLLVLLRAKLHGSGDRQADIRKVAKLAKSVTLITTVNLCGGLLAPFMKLPLLVRFLLLFQVSSNLALLLIWTFLSLKECMIVPDAHTQQQQNSSPEPQAVHRRRRCSTTYQRSKLDQQIWSDTAFSTQIRVILRKGFEESHDILQSSRFERAEEGSEARNKATRGAVHDVDGVGGKVDEAGGSGSGHGSEASGSEENRGRYGGNDGGGGAAGGGNRGESGSGHGSGASGSGENSDGDGGHGRDEGGTGSGHGSGAGGSEENRGGSEGGDRGRDGGGADPESGGRGTNTEQALQSSKIIETSLHLTAQTTGTLIGFHSMSTPSSSSKALLVVALMDQLVAYLCGVTGILLNKPEDSKAAKIFEDIGIVCSTLGYILMIAMYLPWYLVLIVVLLFGVVWLIFFRDRLKTRATEVWNCLKNARNL